MSFKRRFQYRYANLLAVLRSIRMFNWMFSGRTRGVLFAILAVFGILYIVKTTSFASTGYEINNLEKQVDQLENEIQKINIEVADFSSINNIKTRLSGLDMVTAEKIKYLQPKQEEMAKK